MSRPRIANRGSLAEVGGGSLCDPWIAVSDAHRFTRCSESVPLRSLLLNALPSSLSCLRAETTSSQTAPSPYLFSPAPGRLSSTRYVYTRRRRFLFVTEKLADVTCDTVFSLSRTRSNAVHVCVIAAVTETCVPSVRVKIPFQCPSRFGIGNTLEPFARLSMGRRQMNLLNKTTNTPNAVNAEEHISS